MTLSTMVNTWMKVLGNPREETFQEELDSPRATLGTAIFWVFVSSTVVGVGGLCLYTSLLVLPMLMAFSEPAMSMSEVLSILFAEGGAASIFLAFQAGLIFLTPVLYLGVVGFLYLLARLLGGQGEFGRYAYLLATFYAPLNIIGNMANIIPFIGFFVMMGAFGYQIVLGYLATKAAFNLSVGRALVVVLTPVFLGIFLITLAFMLLLVGLFSLSEGATY